MGQALFFVGHSLQAIWIQPCRPVFHRVPPVSHLFGMLCDVGTIGGGFGDAMGFLDRSADGGCDVGDRVPAIAETHVAVCGGA